MGNAYRLRNSVSGTHGETFPSTFCWSNFIPAFTTSPSRRQRPDSNERKNCQRKQYLISLIIRLLNQTGFQQSLRRMRNLKLSCESLPQLGCTCRKASGKAHSLYRTKVNLITRRSCGSNPFPAIEKGTFLSEIRLKRFFFCVKSNMGANEDTMDSAVLTPNWLQ